jgi:hypothetical protein
MEWHLRHDGKVFISSEKVTVRRYVRFEDRGGRTYSTLEEIPYRLLSE